MRRTIEYQSRKTCWEIVGHPIHAMPFKPFFFSNLFGFKQICIAGPAMGQMRKSPADELALTSYSSDIFLRNLNSLTHKKKASNREKEREERPGWIVYPLPSRADYQSGQPPQKKEKLDRFYFFFRFSHHG